MNQGKKHSMLIVDDEKSYIMELTQVFARDYVLSAVKNGRDALSSAEKSLPDIILLDIIMPDIDGFEVIKELKSNEKTKNIPVIFLSGLDDPATEARGLAAGAADFISKPFSHEVIKLRIANVIKLHYKD